MAGGAAPITFGYQPKASGKDTGPWPAPGFQGFLSFIGLPAKPLTYFFHGSQGPAVALDTGDCSSLTAAAGLALFVEGKLKIVAHQSYRI